MTAKTVWEQGHEPGRQLVALGLAVALSVVALDLLDEPLLTSTLILPGETEPRTSGWDVKEELDHQVDLVVEAGETPAEPTTVVDWSDGVPEIIRRGAGDPERFGA